MSELERIILYATFGLTIGLWIGKITTVVY